MEDGSFHGTAVPSRQRLVKIHNAEIRSVPPVRSLRRGGEHVAPVAQYHARRDWCNDARTGMPLGIPKGAMCVQRFDDSLNSAIHITYRISLRSSSMPEPRDPLLKVLIEFNFVLGRQLMQSFGW